MRSDARKALAAKRTQAEQAPSECECGHGLQWHHHRRGCGYHGFSADHRCPCPMPFDDALAAHDRRVRADAWDEGHKTFCACGPFEDPQCDNPYRGSPVPDPSRPADNNTKEPS